MFIITSIKIYFISCNTGILAIAPIESSSPSEIFFYFNINLVDNWQDVCEEICRSNIIQRDNQKFARKLSKDLVKLAKERSDLVSTKLSYLILG